MSVQRLRKSAKGIYLNARKLGFALLPKTSPVAEVPHGISSILVISQRRLGDIALEIPALNLLRRNHGAAKLGIIAPSSYHELLAWACRPDCLCDCPATYADLLRLTRTMRGRNWQVAVDLTTDYHLAGALLAWRSAGMRIGFENAGRGHFFNVVVAISSNEHMGDRFRRALKPLGVSPDAAADLPELPEIKVSLPRKQAGTRLVGIHPGGVHPTQRWSTHYFAELACRIQTAGNPCVILGGPGDDSLVREINRLAPNSVSVTTADVIQLAVILKRLDLLICNNSGPLHLAELLGVQTLSFMGPSVKDLWAPQDPRARVLRRDDLGCIGCNQGYCETNTHECMKSITPEDAFNAFNSVFPH